MWRAGRRDAGPAAGQGRFPDRKDKARARHADDYRDALPRDEADVVDLWRRCGLVASYNDPVADFRFAMAGAASAVLVGEEASGGLCGTVMVGHDGHRGWLYYVAASPDHRRQGIGRLMVEAGELWLRDRNVPKVQLMIRETNRSVAPFYERLGYENAPRIVMSRWLHPPA